MCFMFYIILHIYGTVRVETYILYQVAYRKAQSVLPPVCHQRGLGKYEPVYSVCYIETLSLFLSMGFVSRNYVSRIQVTDGTTL